MFTKLTNQQCNRQKENYENQLERISRIVDHTNKYFAPLQTIIDLKMKRSLTIRQRLYVGGDVGKCSTLNF